MQLKLDSSPKKKRTQLVSNKENQTARLTVKNCRRLAEAFSHGYEANAQIFSLRGIVYFF